MVYYRMLNIVPWAAQEDLFTHSLCDSLHLLIPNSQCIPPSPFPLAITGLFSTSLNLFGR